MAANLPYPPLNFHFEVQFHHKDFHNDSRFQSVQGLHAQLIKEEGQKNPHAVFGNLVLKRAFEPDSKLMAWCMNAINNLVFQEVNMTIRLLDSKHEPLAAWQVVKVIPVGWEVAELDAQDSKILIETLTLKYHYFQVVNGKGKVVAPKAPTR